MRKLIVCNMMSVDGYYEGPGKNVMDLFAYRAKEYPDDESFDIYNAERLRAADTLLLGRKSYAGFMGYWPPVADDPNAGPVVREVSRRMNTMGKVVISDTLLLRKSDPWHNTRVVGRTDAQEEIAKLKRRKGKEILVFASHNLWNGLLTNGLVDELHLVIAPVVLGGGIPLFSGKPGGSLRLIDSRTWEGSGTVLVRYEVGL
jgi:dihydrofolate reductase